MRMVRNPGRVAGLWYLVLVFVGPLSLIYIPTKLYVSGNATATAANIAAHEWLFRFGIVGDLIGAVVLVLLALAFYRLFKDLDQHLAVLVVIFGGVMPSLLYLVNVVSDAAALSIVHGVGFLSVFDKSQRDALAMLFLQLHDLQNTAAEILWGLWLFPLGTLVYRSRVVPRFLGVWLIVAGFAYLIMCLAGVLAPQYQEQVFRYSQPARIGEAVFMLWLVIRGARPPVPGFTPPAGPQSGPLGKP